MEEVGIVVLIVRAEEVVEAVRITMAVLGFQLWAVVEVEVAIQFVMGVKIWGFWPSYGTG